MSEVSNRSGTDKKIVLFLVTTRKIVENRSHNQTLNNQIQLVMYNFSFICRTSKIDKKGFAPIEISIVINGQRTHISLPMKSEPIKFNKMMADIVILTLQKPLEMGLYIYLLAKNVFFMSKKHLCIDIFCIFCIVIINRNDMQQIDEYSNKNRLKVVLAEQNKSGKWLALQLGKTENTISRWVRNINQPTVEQLFDIAKILNVDVKTLLNSNND